MSVEVRKRPATASSTDDGDHVANDNERLLKLPRLAVVVLDELEDPRFPRRRPQGRLCTFLRSVQKLPPLSEKRKQEVWKILHQDLPTVDNNNILPLEKLAGLCMNEYMGYKGEDYEEDTNYDDRHYEGRNKDYCKGYYDWDKYEYDLFAFGYHPIGVAYKVIIVKNGGVALINDIMKQSMKQGNNNNKVLGEVIRCFFHLIAYSHKKSARLGVVESVIQVMNNYAEDEYIQIYGCGFLDKFLLFCQKVEEESVVVNNNGIRTIVNAMERFPGNKILQKWACQALDLICITDDFRGLVLEARGLGAVARVVENVEFHADTKQYAFAVLEILSRTYEASQEEPQKSTPIINSGVCVCDEEAPGDNGDDDGDETYVPPTEEQGDDDNDDDYLDEDYVDEANDDNDDDSSASDDDDENNLVGTPWHCVPPHPSLYKKNDTQN